MTHEHLLDGCTPAPLAHYLKALGVLKLVAEQKDPDAAGRWQGERFVLRTVLNREELERFFLEEFKPTPIVAPWNGGSGFYPTDNKNGIDSIASATAQRVIPYRTVITLVRDLVGEKEESPKQEEKTLFLLHLRASLPDTALLWFDAAVLLSTEKPSYPPLLGTGGNDGRLDFTNNFMQRLTELFSMTDGKSTSNATAWLKGSFYGTSSPSLIRRAIGQFAPGNAGGPNATTGFDSASLINPWDFVLMLEGALLFASSVTRRLESYDSATLSFPFTVRTTGSGSGCGKVVDEGQSRAETWVPLWRNDISYSELRSLLSEGRVTVGRRAAKDGLDFTRAVSRFGVDRGISDFQRYAFLMRSGKAYLATPLSRIQVVRTPQTDLLNHLDCHAWLDRLRRFARDKNAPGRIQQLVRRLEDEIFSLTQGGGRLAIQNLLMLLGQIELVCAKSGKMQEAVAPAPKLGAEWALEADDNSHEFRLACALAGLSAMRNSVVPLREDEKTKKVEWHPGSRLAVWSGNDLLPNLIRILNRRMLESQRGQQESPPLVGHPAADLAAVMAFLQAKTDDRRLAGLLTGLVHVDLPKHLPFRDVASEQPPAVFIILKPLFTPGSILHQLGLLPQDSPLPLPGKIVTLLSTGNRQQAERAVAIAWRRLQIAGLKIPAHPRQPPGLANIDPVRLAAGLMIPLAKGDLSRIGKPFIPVQEIV
ncbi:MAG: type I-G CRISPR-associated protein Cas8g1/Csx17 [Thermodesulfobacteriota bacterium]